MVFPLIINRRMVLTSLGWVSECLVPEKVGILRCFTGNHLCNYHNISYTANSPQRLESGSLFLVLSQEAAPTALLAVVKCS